VSRSSTVLCCFLVLSLVAVVARAENGAVAGRIVAGKGIETPARLSVALDAWVCAPDGSTPDPRLVIGPQRGLANVVVTLAVPDAPAYQSEGEALIDQKGCAFTPHVSLVAPGQTVRVRNSDRVLHNFHTITEHNRSVNKAQIKGAEDTFVFAKPEIVRAECDVHYWMSAVIVVAAHRFTAVSDAQGRFTIENVPPGTYQADLWHERLGTRTESVTVSADGGRLDVTWPAKPATEPSPSP
jgi:plastocyanin